MLCFLRFLVFLGCLGFLGLLFPWFSWFAFTFFSVLNVFLLRVFKVFCNKKNARREARSAERLAFFKEVFLKVAFHGNYSLGGGNFGGWDKRPRVCQISDFEGGRPPPPDYLGILAFC